MTYRHALIIGVALGLVAAAVVWYLERFETSRLHGEMRSYMINYDKFRDFMRQKESGDGEAE